MLDCVYCVGAVQNTPDPKLLCANLCGKFHSKSVKEADTSQNTLPLRKGALTKKINMGDVRLRLSLCQKIFPLARQVIQFLD